MKRSRNKSVRRSSTSKASNGTNKKNGINSGLSPSKRHREKLNSVMDELCELLPLSNGIKTSLDRLSVLKLTISFFHTRNLMITDSSNASKQLRNCEHQADEKNISEMALQAIGGFFLVINQDGIVNYVSDNVKSYIGYAQTRLMHEEFFLIIDQDDVQGLKNCFQTQNFSIKGNCRKRSNDRGDCQECFCNIKCHAGRLSSHVSPFYYKCFKFFGRIKTITKRLTGEREQGFFALCTPVTRQINVCRPLINNVEKYTCKMNAAMSNLEVDSRGLKYLGLSEKDLSGHSAYFFFHKEDLPGMALAHECLLFGRKVSMSFRVLKGNATWQWVRGRAYSIIDNGKVQGMVSNNTLLSEEEGQYFKEQDIKDIMDWKAQKDHLPCSSSCSSQSDNSTKSDRMSPCSEQMTFHAVEVATLPSSECQMHNSPGLPSRTVSSQPFKGRSLPPWITQSNKIKSSYQVSKPSQLKEHSYIDTDAMLRIINDLQNSLIENNSTVPGCQNSPNDYSTDVDMITGSANDDVEQQFLDNGLHIFDTPAHSSLPVFSELTNKSEIPRSFENHAAESFVRFPQNGSNSFPSIGPQSIVEELLNDNIHFAASSENDGLQSHSKGLVNLDGNSMVDFIPLPPGEVENILSNDEAPSSLTLPPSTFSPQIDVSSRKMHTNHFLCYQQGQCYGKTFNGGMGSRSDNELLSETTSHCYDRL